MDLNNSIDCTKSSLGTPTVRRECEKAEVM